MLKSIILVAAGGAAGSVARYLASRIIQGIVDGNMALLLTTGFCGGFTTFSTFASETLGLLRSGSIVTGALYAGGSVALGLVAVALGMHITKMI